jgi:hypothetical protein
MQLADQSRGCSADHGTLVVKDLPCSRSPSQDIIVASVQDSNKNSKQHLMEGLRMSAMLFSGGCCRARRRVALRGTPACFLCSGGACWGLCTFCSDWTWVCSNAAMSGREVPLVYTSVRSDSSDSFDPTARDLGARKFWAPRGHSART